MTTTDVTAVAEARDHSATTRALLGCGVVAGPLFVVTAGTQVLTRDGFDLAEHPISMLGVGDHGWVQISNFILAGLLGVAFAVGCARVLRTGRGSGRGSTWGPRLLALHGIGLVAGGVFVPDPALGFPPGAPDGIPDELSWHAALHAAAPPLAFLALIAACVVFARRFAATDDRRRAAYSVATAVVCLVLAGWPGDGMSVRLAVAVTLGFAWQTALALKLRKW